MRQSIKILVFWLTIIFGFIYWFINSQEESYNLLVVSIKYIYDTIIDIIFTPEGHFYFYDCFVIFFVDFVWDAYFYIITKFEGKFFFFFFLIYLFCVLFSFLFTSFLGLYGVFIFVFLSIFIFWLSLIYNMSYFLVENNVIYFILGKWFKLTNSIIVNFEFYVDFTSFSFLLLTTTIAVFVNIYIFTYFRYEPNVERLTLFLNSFVISMLIFVMSANLIMLFFGWELIGITSFVLINFWSTKVSTLKAAFKAYSFNKLSDFFFFMAILTCVMVFNEININEINNGIVFYNNYYIFSFVDIKITEFLAIFFLLAAFIKSAQFGFHVWLPDSMEAPVPASALIHSATLVSAGIFLVLKLYPIFKLSNFFIIVTPCVGALTALVGGLGAVFQSDLKKILAYSTISHCGFLMFIASTGYIEGTLFYLYVHGFFKAIIFLCAGNIIRFNKNYQDLKRMGQFWKYLPFEFSIVLISLLNLSGLPFYFGFYIKHSLFVVNNLNLLEKINFTFLFLAALTGLFYSYKIIYYVFFDIKKARKSIYLDLNPNTLKTYFFTNSNNGSIFGILSLLIVAYFILFNFYFSFLNSISKIDFSDSNVNLNLKYLFYNNDQNILTNYSIFNWTIVILFLLLSFFRWNYKFNSYLLINNFFLVITFIIFLRILINNFFIFNPYIYIFLFLLFFFINIWYYRNE